MVDHAERPDAAGRGRTRPDAAGRGRTRPDAAGRGRTRLVQPVAR
ncbi:hypothetical protein OHR68_41865 [Spirillospora sp. NBC_00431]